MYIPYGETANRYLACGETRVVTDLIQTENHRYWRIGMTSLATNPMMAFAVILCLLGSFFICVVGITIPSTTFITQPTAYTPVTIETNRVIPAVVTNDGNLAQVVTGPAGIYAAGATAMGGVPPVASVKIKQQAVSPAMTMTTSEVPNMKCYLWMPRDCDAKWAVVSPAAIPGGMNENVKFKGATCGAECVSSSAAGMSYTGYCRCTRMPDGYTS